METIVLHCRRAIMFWMCRGAGAVTFARNHSDSRLCRLELSVSIWTSIPAFVRQHNFRTELASVPIAFVEIIARDLEPREGKGIQLEAPLCMSLERAIEYIDIVEATPKALPLRKRILDVTARKRALVI